MRSTSNYFNYFSQNKLTKLANFMQFKRMFMFCLEDWGAWALCLPPCLHHWWLDWLNSGILGV